jgi:hypothetical protein
MSLLSSFHLGSLPFENAIFCNGWNCSVVLYCAFNVIPELFLFLCCIKIFAGILNENLTIMTYSGEPVRWYLHRFNIQKAVLSIISPTAFPYGTLIWLLSYRFVVKIACPVSFSCFFFNRLFNVLVYDSTSVVKLWGFIFLNNLLIIPSPTKLRRDWQSIGFQILLRTKYVPSLVKINWRILIVEC